MLFVILGLTVFIPLTNAAGFPASIFAIIWTVIAAASTLYYGINLFRRGGVSSHDIDIETTPAEATAEPDFDEKRRKLAQLKQEGEREAISDIGVGRERPCLQHNRPDDQERSPVI